RVIWVAATGWLSAAARENRPSRPPGLEGIRYAVPALLLKPGAPIRNGLPGVVLILPTSDTEKPARSPATPPANVALVIVVGTLLRVMFPCRGVPLGVLLNGWP